MRLHDSVATLLLTALSWQTSSAKKAHSLERNFPTLPLGLWRTLRDSDNTIRATDARLNALEDKYPAHTLDVPIDHFGNDSSRFPLRFWYDAQYYKPGGPVFCLDGGETDGSDRLPFLDHGILKILSKAIGGLSVVLEHRYYGESFPVPDLSTDNMRFLTTQQALADNAYFTQNASFPDLPKDTQDSLKSAKWIHIGGSYAGAKVALLRKLYPDVVFGAIASSAVTAAVTDYWEYFEAIRLHGDSNCVDAIVQSISLLDEILALEDTQATQRVKNLFSLSNVSHVQDFVALLTYPLGAWQARNWDPEVGSTGFEDFCTDLLDTGSVEQPLYDQTSQQHPIFQATSTPSLHLANYAKYIRENVAPLCKTPNQDECFGTFDGESYKAHTLDQTWRSWTFQYCTEWGYFQSAPPAGVPSLLSRHIDMNYTSMVCQLAFPDGKLIKMPAAPNVTAINQYGGFELAADRIAFIDGSADPWIYATPHSPNVAQRENTLLRPFEVIDGGVHHWDENGLKRRKERGDMKHEPTEIARIRAREVDFVKSWLGL